MTCRKNEVRMLRINWPATRCFLVTYAPLVATAAGRTASENRGIAPFVDGSIRREPDLEQPFPGDFLPVP